MSRRHSNRNAQQDRSGHGKVKHLPHEGGRTVKESFQEQREAKLFLITPKNESQKKYLEYAKRCQLVIAFGSSGTGKTFIACVHAANQLTTGQIDRIVLTRPPEGVGNTIGFRKGTVEEKLSGPYQSMVEPLRMVFGGSYYDLLVKSGKIVMEPLEDVRGRSYRSTCILVDEASNTDIKSMQTLVTRVGSGSQIILCGDTAPWQQDIKGVSGLSWIINRIKELRVNKDDFLDHEDRTNLYENIGIVEFTPQDVVRSGITKLFVKAFDNMRSD